MHNLVLDRREPFHELRFVRPDTMNTLSLEMIEELDEALGDVASQSPRCLLLTADGRNFMAGGDLGYLREAGEESPAEARKVIEALNRMFKRLTALPCPIVLAAQGAVAGAGISLVLACDWAIAANDSRFVFAYDKIATTPDGGLTWMLPRSIGLRHAMRLALSAQPVDASEALRLGILAEIVPGGELQQSAEATAARLAAGPTLAYSATRRLMLEAFDRSFDDHLDAELESFCDLAATRDFRGAVEAFFQRKQPVYEGR